MAKPGAGGAIKAQKEQLEKLVKGYLVKEKIFIIDPASASRRRLANTLGTLGAQQNLITMHGDYDAAEAELKEVKPKVVVTEYQVGFRSGLDLLMAQREAHPDTQKCIFILITSNASQSTVARAAEEDVDCFIVKPYTLEILRNTIVKAITDKIHPSPYRKKVDEGKALLFGGKIAEAKEVFKQAVPLDSAPSLAHFYYGQAEFMEKALEDAKGEYVKGLNYNKIHYKCLIGIFDLLMSQKKFPEAYEIVRKVAKYFPANPKRLGSVIRLAVLTSQYEDMEGYYQLFKQLECREDEIIKFMSAGLITTAKYYFRQNHRNRAIELLNNCSISCAGRAGFLRKITEVMAENDLSKEIEKVLPRFPAETQDGIDYLFSKALQSFSRKEHMKYLDEVRKLEADKLTCAGIYLFSARAYVELGKFEKAMASLEEAKLKFPQDKGDFEKLQTELTRDQLRDGSKSEKKKAA